MKTGGVMEGAYSIPSAVSDILFYSVLFYSILLELYI